MLCHLECPDILKPLSGRSLARSDNPGWEPHTRMPRRPRNGVRGQNRVEECETQRRCCNIRGDPRSSEPLQILTLPRPVVEALQKDDIAQADERDIDVKVVREGYARRAYPRQPLQEIRDHNQCVGLIALAPGQHCDPWDAEQAKP